MIYYILFYACNVLLISLYARYLSRARWGSAKLSLFSFISSVFILLLWNLYGAEAVYGEEVLVSGVSVVMKSAVGIVILLVISLLFHIGITLCRNAVRRTDVRRQ